jgi:hypothetical protein
MTTNTLSTTPRFDLYASVHKALRMAMSDALARVGCIDITDHVETAAALETARTLLDLCRSHLDHENRFVHPALEALKPGGSSRIAGEHEEHLLAIDALESDLAALAEAPTPARAHHLYLHLASFVGENFEHMDAEEALHNAALWAGYSDAELMAIEQRIVAAVPPQKMMEFLHWMLPAMNPAERAGMLGGMREQMPPAAFDGVQDLAQQRLSKAQWAKLAAALGIAVDTSPAMSA